MIMTMSLRTGIDVLAHEFAQSALGLGRRTRMAVTVPRFMTMAMLVLTVSTALRMAMTTVAVTVLMARLLPTLGCRAVSGGSACILRRLCGRTVIMMICVRNG
jgi:hypothetical protein